MTFALNEIEAMAKEELVVETPLEAKRLSDFNNLLTAMEAKERAEARGLLLALALSR